MYIQIAPGSFIELFPDPQDAPGTLPAPDPQASYKHVCLLVDDLPATLCELAERGLEITGPPIQGLDTNLQYWITDPDGNPIELMQIKPTSPQAAADARKQSVSTQVKAKYNHTTFWGLYVPCQQVLSQICSEIVQKHRTRWEVSSQAVVLVEMGGS